MRQDIVSYAAFSLRTACVMCLHVHFGIHPYPKYTEGFLEQYFVRGDTYNTYKVSVGLTASFCEVGRLVFVGGI